MQANKNVYRSVWSDEFPSAYHEKYRELVDEKKLCHKNVHAVSCDPC